MRSSSGIYANKYLECIKSVSELNNNTYLSSFIENIGIYLTDIGSFMTPKTFELIDIDAADVLQLNIQFPIYKPPAGKAREVDDMSESRCMRSLNQ